MNKAVTVDETMLTNVATLAAAGVLEITGIPIAQRQAWLAALQSAEVELKRAGWFRVDDKQVVFPEGERRSHYCVRLDGYHICRPYDEGQPCRHLAALHIIKLYLAALELPALVVPQVRDVFAHRPAIKQGPARREGFNLQQALGREW